MNRPPRERDLFRRRGGRRRSPDRFRIRTGDRIVATPAPRMAPCQSPHRKPASPPGTVTPNGFQGVVGTRGFESTPCRGPRQSHLERRQNPPVSVDQQKQHVAHDVILSRSRRARSRSKAPPRANSGEDHVPPSAATCPRLRSAPRARAGRDPKSDADSIEMPRGSAGEPGTEPPRLQPGGSSQVQAGLRFPLRTDASSEADPRTPAVPPPPSAARIRGSRTISWRARIRIPIDAAGRKAARPQTAVRRLRPSLRRLRMTLRPPRVDMRARNPSWRFRRIFEGWY